MSEKTRIQTTVSSRKEASKERSDNPKRGGKVGSDVKIAEGTKIGEIIHEDRTDIILNVKM